METAGLSTAIMLALAVLLWFLYFLPTWIRRREYLATERTAARLQRTVRIMAEAAELPNEVRIEATAREAARAERLRLAEEREIARAALRDAEAAAAERARIEADRRQAAALRRATPGAAHAARQGRLRRARRVVGLLLLLAVVAAGYQLFLMATGGIAPGAWVVLGLSGLSAAASIAVQQRIRAQLRPAAPVVRVASRPVAAPAAAPAASAAPRRAWTPQPLPRPRYLEHPEAAPLGPSLGAPTMDAAARLRVAAAAASLSEAKVAALPQREAAPPAEAPAAPATPGVSSRYATMGLVGDLGAATPDLDEVLARRRQVG